MNDGQTTRASEFQNWRVIDANRNRATEACRVIEEYCRFHVNSAFHAEMIKELRHCVASIVIDLAKSKREASTTVFDPLLSARDTIGDVGTSIDAVDEFSKSTVEDLIAANFSRLQQSLRVLEEYAKLLEGDQSSAIAAKKLEQARYESYTIQKTLNHLVGSNQRLKTSLLCVLTDGAESQEAFASRIKMLAGAGVDMIQLRDKAMASGELLSRAVLARLICRSEDLLLIINDRPDVCLLSDADGVHVGQTDLSVSDARRIVGTRLVGLSTHSLEQAEQAVRDGADYIGVGPVFQSKTKNFDEVKGLELLSVVSSRIPLPAFAIGGINESNIEEIIKGGGSRIAVSGGVLKAKDSAIAASNLKNALKERSQHSIEAQEG